MGATDGPDERWQRVKACFDEALDLDATGRMDFLKRLQASDPDIAREVETLLAADERTDAFLASTTLRPEMWGVPSSVDSGRQPLSGQFGRYRILSVLGKGGMGEVYLAHEAALDRDVALKVLPESLASRPAYRDALLREARAAASLNHPNITTIHEIGSVEGRDFIALEYVQGEGLRDRLARGPLTLREILDLAIPLADALAYAHQQGVIHRDIKAANVMVAGRGAPKLLDFGLATKGATDGQSESRIAGTPSAMSPEQAQGKPLDERSDVFSFGSLLYELATGKPAFGGSTLKEVLNAVVHTRPRPLSEARSDLPKSLDVVVDRAMQPSPSERYPSMQALAADLRQIAATSERRRFPLGVALALLVAVVLMAVLAFEVGSARHPTGGAHTSVAVMGFGNPDDRTDAAGIGPMLTRLVAADLANAHGLAMASEERLYDAARRTGHDDTRLERAAAVDVARSVGADVFVVGRFRREADGLVVHAELDDVSGHSVASVQARGATDNDVFNIADSIAHQLRAALQEPEMTEAERQALAQQLTSSVDAYRAYVRGLDAFVRNDTKLAVAALHEATVLDPAFALAQFRLSLALVYTGAFEESTTALERTYAFRDKLPENARLVLDALGPSYLIDDHTNELPLLLRVLERDPANSDAMYMLGEIYTHSASRSDSAKAAANYERLLTVNPGLVLVYDHRLQSLLRLGRIEDAAKQLADWADRKPDNFNALQGTLALWQGDFDRASTLLPDPLIPEFLAHDGDSPRVQHVLAATADENASDVSALGGAYLVLALDLRADILAAHGKFDEAIDLYRRAASVPGIMSPDGFHTSLRNGARHREASLLELRGDRGAARQLVASTVESQPGSYKCLFMDGLLALRDSDIASCQSRLETLERLASQNVGPAAGLYREALAAQLAFAEGRAGEAIVSERNLLDGPRVMEDWYVHEDSIGPVVRDDLARALASEGRSVEADQAWADLETSGLERLRHPVPWVLSFFERGRLACEQGRKADGKELLQKFLERWGANSDLPQVVEARRLVDG
jgi:tetratricopeptide (TPR) repeat protein/predicted Ser/Thr protein kinase